MKYLIGSGYHWREGRDPEFQKLWIDNINRYCDPKPSRIVVISTGGHGLPFVRPDVDEIQLSGDLGGFMALVNGQKPHKLTGWMGAVLAGALIAYCDEADYIYLEEDCLAFGPWVKQLYAEVGDAGVLYGAKHTAEPWQPCSQSLFMVRHSYIPAFVRQILEGPPMNTRETLGEHQFERCREKYPEQWKFFSLQCDRQRPLPLGYAIWYAQQLTTEELALLKEKKFISTTAP
jgi:hypothetical protein